MFGHGIDKLSVFDCATELFPRDIYCKRSELKFYYFLLFSIWIMGIMARMTRLLLDVEPLSLYLCPTPMQFTGVLPAGVLITPVKRRGMYLRVEVVAPVYDCR